MNIVPYLLFSMSNTSYYDSQRRSAKALEVQGLVYFVFFLLLLHPFLLFLLLHMPHPPPPSLSMPPLFQVFVRGYASARSVVEEVMGPQLFSGFMVSAYALSLTTTLQLLHTEQS